MCEIDTSDLQICKMTSTNTNMKPSWDAVSGSIHYLSDAKTPSWATSCESPTSSSEFWIESILELTLLPIADCSEDAGLWGDNSCDYSSSVEEEDCYQNSIKLFLNSF
jgi:hypothetical protein